MAIKKKQNSNKIIERNRENLEEGIRIYNSNPLFKDLGGCLKVVNSEQMGKNAPAITYSDGDIYLNIKCNLSPSNWAYVIAHCRLHLAFAHFDAEKMPGFEKTNADGSKLWQVACDNYLWNAACDLYIAKFLQDVKLGTPLHNFLPNTFPGSLTDEKKIYDYLKEHPNTVSFIYGTAGENAMDMIGLDTPLVYNTSRNRRNEYAVRFAYALAHSVSHVVSSAGGHDSIGNSYTTSQKAANWFISHYPLLGGLATGFRIIEDFQYCNKEEISIAAVDVTLGEIYINPAAGLTQEELKFVLAHEFLHAGLMHHERCQGRDPYLWNIACDYVINGWLHDMQIGEMPQRGLLYDETLKNISAENLYDQMVRDLKKFSKLDTLRGYGKGDIMKNPKGFSSFDNSSATSLDDFYKNALRNGLEYHTEQSRGYIPVGLIEEIRALSMPPIPWDVELAQWFDFYFAPLEKHRSYGRPSRRQGSTPNIPRPRYISSDIPESNRTFGVVIDTSGSMSTKLLGYALGAIASYASSREVPFARVVFCDAAAYDAGYISPDDIAGRVCVKGRGGTILQPGINLLETADDFPKDGPILIITDGEIENHMTIRHEHAFLIPRGKRLPFQPKGKVFYFHV